MVIQVLFVSVNKSFREDMNLAEVEACAVGNWDMTVAKAGTCKRVVAVFNFGDGGPAEPVGAWRLRGAYASAQPPEPGHHRTALALGEPMPILAAYSQPPSLRRGVATDARELS